MRCLARLFLFVLLMGALLRPAAAQSLPAEGAAATQPAGVKVVLSTSVEEGKKQLVATVTREGKPLAGATVSFYAQRTFGRLVLGTDQTLDDGTAAIAFPSDLPGAPAGELHLSAAITAPLSVSGAATEGVFAGGRPIAASAEPFPRALWAPQAPVGLILAIALLLCGAWGAYAFVVAQLLIIRRGAST